MDNDTITIFKGEYLAKILQESGISAIFQNEEITENYIIYNFSVDEIIDSKRIKSALDIMSEVLQTTVIENHNNDSKSDLSIKIVVQHEKTPKNPKLQPENTKSKSFLKRVKDWFHKLLKKTNSEEYSIDELNDFDSMDD